MKIAVWGLGNHAINKILPAFKENNHLELYGVHSRNNHVVNECYVENYNLDKIFEKESLSFSYFESSRCFFEVSYISDKIKEAGFVPIKKD